MDLDKAIQNRHSVRRFKEKKPNWRKIIEAVDAARYAPMAGNNYSLKFILVSDEKKIQELAKASQQPFVAKAGYVVVVCSDKKRTANAFGEKADIYCKQQAGAAIQNFLLKLVEEDLATCWVGHFVEKIVKRVLKIPESIDVEAMFPIGIEPEKKSTRRLKIDLDKILYFNKYKEKRMKALKKIEA